MQLLVTIVDRAKAGRALNFFKRKSVYLTLSCWGEGTASTEIRDILGFGEKAKVVIFSIVPEKWLPVVITHISDEMLLRNTGRGILFSIPISSVNKGIPRRYLSAIYEEKNEERVMYKTTEQKYEMIIVSAEAGNVDAVMEAARAAGARGGTVLKARATGDENTDSFFGLKIYDEMEVLAIVVGVEDKHKIMNAIAGRLQERDPDHGMLFSVPVTDIIGIGACPDNKDK